MSDLKQSKNSGLERRLLSILLTVFISLMAYSQTRVLYSQIDDNMGYSWRDIDQDYLMLRSYQDGRSIYRSIPDLVKQYLPDRNPLGLLRHPSPRPPSLIAMLIPLTNMDLETYGHVWFFLSLGVLFGVSIILCNLFVEQRCFSSSKNSLILVLSKLQNLVLVFAVLLLLLPVRDNLFWGQYAIFNLLILLIAYRCILVKRYFLVGILIGLALSIQSLVWPIIVYFLFKKNIRVLSGIFLSFITLNIIALCFFGLSDFLFYFQVAVPQAIKYWQYVPANISITRFFSSFFYGREVSPLWPFFIPSFKTFKSPNLFFCLIDGLFYFAFLFLVFRRTLSTKEDESRAFIRLMIILPILSPIGWINYAVLIIPAGFFLISATLREIRDNISDALFSRLYQLGFLIIIFYPTTYEVLAALVFRQPPTTDYWILPYDVMLFSALPTIAIAIFSLIFEPSISEKSRE